MRGQVLPARQAPQFMKMEKQHAVLIRPDRAFARGNRSGAHIPWREIGAVVGQHMYTLEQNGELVQIALIREAAVLHPVKTPFDCALPPPLQTGFSTRIRAERNPPDIV